MQQRKQPREPERKVKKCKLCGRKWDDHDIKIDPTTRKLKWICK